VLTTDNTVDYVDVEEAEGGLTYHKLFLDTHGRPHRTGDSLDQLPDGVVITHVELWDESPEHKEPGEELAEEPEDEDDDEPGKPFPTLALPSWAHHHHVPAERRLASPGPGGK
jgi:hypothetical protein